MGSRIRKILESILFAGMKPGRPRAEAQRMRLLGPLREPVEWLLSGGSHADPLYLSNRTFGDRLKRWVLLGLPLLLLVGGGVVAFQLLHHKPGPDAKDLTPQEMAARMLPNLDRNIQLEANENLVVTDVHVDRTGEPKLKGSMRNNTNHEIRFGEAVFQVTERSGAMLGAVTVTVANVAAGATVKFEAPVPQRSAAYAVVREVHSQ